MTDETESDETKAPARALTRSERIFVRISIWQTVLSVVGLFVAAVALYAALTESEAVRRQTAASVWPYVQLTVSDHERPDSAEFKLTLTNAGVGPARMHAMRVTVNGAAQRTWEDAIAGVGAQASQPFSQNSVGNRVIQAGESVDIFRVTEPALTRRFRDAVAQGAGAVEYCYCSIFEQCWAADSRRSDDGPRSVQRCPDYGAEQFQGDGD